MKSLLEYSDFEFCLVSNGCTSEENELLMSLSMNDERLSYYCYSEDEIFTHGVVLDALQSQCCEEYFCFMDSDIFASKRLPDFNNLLLEDTVGIFSCMPSWVLPKEYIFEVDFRILLGTYNQLPNGDSIGSTYFAIYNQKCLGQIKQHYNVSFKEGPRSDQSLYVGDVMSSLGFNQEFFDTGKVINVLMRKHNMKLINIDLTNMHHIGGLSFETTARSLNNYDSLKERLKNMLENRVITNHLVQIYRKLMFYKRFSRLDSVEFEINYQQRVLRRNAIRKYFGDLIIALDSESSCPILPSFDDAFLNRRLSDMSHAFIKNYLMFDFVED